MRLQEFLGSLPGFRGWSRFRYEGIPLRLSDDEWFGYLKRSVSDASLGLPGFPPAEVQSRYIGSHGVGSLKEVRKFHSHIRKQTDFSNAAPILDFGCGYGRMIRAFLNDFRPDQLFGVDVSDEALGFVKSTGVPGAYYQISPGGSLPFDDNTFGLVYAYSVFTHLSEPEQDNWLGEIQRVLKPGGTIIATVEPPRVFEHFASIDLTKPVNDPWRAENARIIQGDPTFGEALRERGFTYFGGQHYGDAFMTPEYVRDHWGSWFDIVDHLDDPQRFFQAIVTARTRSS